MNAETKKIYIVQDSFAIRSGVEVLPGQEVELTIDQARAFLHSDRIRLKPPALEEPQGGPEVETRDPESTDRDPRGRRRR